MVQLVIMRSLNPSVNSNFLIFNNRNCNNWAISILKLGPNLYYHNKIYKSLLKALICILICINFDGLCVTAGGNFHWEKGLKGLTLDPIQLLF